MDRGGDLSEKCDVYSFGVLLLVLIAGRRPLQVTGSPMSQFQRANLISWARHLTRAGKLIDLVDQSIQSFDQEQALLGITVALLCLQKSPARRPSMKEVVGMLSGELESPQLPIEFSPSPPSRFPFKSHKKDLHPLYFVLEMEISTSSHQTLRPHNGEAAIVVTAPLQQNFSDQKPHNGEAAIVVTAPHQQNSSDQTCFHYCNRVPLAYSLCIKILAIFLPF
ncbi:receptor-like serine/threonine-protein kinase At2g45590 [Actinidia eriantha]|uniref:receptor-like serine/threonine-protein kinase At2g45590 n=1 Tax=Actinidia eriantha TaxID=165200 RepID=UPI00258F03F4|nr:receptor-like serine/threonine-protein kinase At2g45590 [Actinidia eriantha]